MINNPKNLMVITPVFLETRSALYANLHTVSFAEHPQLNAKHLLIQDGVCNLVDLITATEFENAIECVSARYNHDDYGDYVRRLGTKIALRCSMDAITFLDGDNAWEHDHIRSICETRERTGKNIIISGRKLLADDGSVAEEFDKRFFDTNNQILFN